MDTRGRVGVTVAFVSFVGLVMLWPILFSLKVDGTISASWGAVWTPLWVFNVAGTGAMLPSPPRPYEAKGFCLVCWLRLYLVRQLGNKRYACRIRYGGFVEKFAEV